MIENNPSNVSSGFEMLLEEVEAEIDFFARIGSRTFSSDIILYQAEDERNRIKVRLENETVKDFLSVRRERRAAT